MSRISFWIFFLLGLSCVAAIANKESHQSRHEQECMISGAIVGAFWNSVNYAIKEGGRASNILSVHDLNSISSRGNPRWYARIDMPHKNVPFPHININPKVTGVADPHIPISEATAHAAGMAGKAMKVVNEVVPVIMTAKVAYELWDIASDAVNGRTVEAKRKVVNMAATNGGGYVGATQGAAYGTAIFPGVGTMFGAIVGGAVGGMVGGMAGDVANFLHEL